MAPKRPPQPDAPPAPLSSEEEVTSSGEEEEDASKQGSSSEEDEAVDYKLKNSGPLPSSSDTGKKQQQSQDSSSESESGSDSDSDSDAAAEKTVKPIASKPMEETSKGKKIREKPDMAAGSSVKRSNPSVRASKRPKKGLENGIATEDDSKKKDGVSKKLFQRLWSDEDEIAILKGIKEFWAKKGADPWTEMNEFHEFIKSSLHVEVSRIQLQDKFRRLKKKYKNNLKRGKKGVDPTFTKDHEKNAFELAKKVWGGEGTILFDEQPKINGTPRKNQKANSLFDEQPKVNGTPIKNQKFSSSKSLKEELLLSPEKITDNDKMDVDGDPFSSESVNEVVVFNKNLGTEGLEENIVKRGLEYIGRSKARELEEKWLKLQFEELEHHAKRTEMVRDHTKLLLEAYKSSYN